MQYTEFWFDMLNLSINWSKGLLWGYPIYNQGYIPLTKWDEPPSMFETTGCLSPTYFSMLTDQLKIFEPVNTMAVKHSTNM